MAPNSPLKFTVGSKAGYRVEAVISLSVGVVFGGVVSWIISRHYYRQATADSREAAIAQRLDDCTEGDKTFLVALLQTGQPVPRYAIINVEFETLGGQKGSWGSNTSRGTGWRPRLRYRSPGNPRSQR